MDKNVLRNKKVLGGQEQRDWNKYARKWMNKTRQQILMKLAGYGLKDQMVLVRDGLRRESLMRSMRVKMSKNEEGSINKLSFSFARHGFFIDLGVARGYPKGGSSRSKMEWLFVIQNAQNDMVKKVTQYYGDEYVGAMRKFYGNKD